MASCSAQSRRVLLELRSTRRLVPATRPTRTSDHLPRQHRSLSSSAAAQQQPIFDKVGRAARDTANIITRAPSQFEAANEGGLRILIFGKPGSGKGTLSARLVQKYDLAFVSTGDVLRREIMNKTEVGKEAEAVVASGGLVSDELMLRIIDTELDNLHGRSWILDGFPRTLRQAGLLDSALNEQGRPINMIVHLAVPDAVIMKRISARWVHLPSGRVYNLDFPSSAPKVPGKDDVTGEPLTKRPDDDPVVFQKRLEAFYKSTSPLLEYFRERYPEALHNLHGSTSDEVRIASSQFSYYAPDVDPDLTLAAAPSDNIAGIEKIWPQLQALIDPYRIERKPHIKSAEEVKAVREEADDLKEGQ